MPMQGDQTGWVPEACDGEVHDAPAETPAAIVQTFIERCDLSIPALAVELRLSREVVERYAQRGAPKWFRLALAGVAIRRGAAPQTLTWLLGAPGGTGRVPAEVSRDYSSSADSGAGRSSGWALDGRIGA